MNLIEEMAIRRDAPPCKACRMPVPCAAGKNGCCPAFTYYVHTNALERGAEAYRRHLWWMMRHMTWRRQA